MPRKLGRKPRSFNPNVAHMRTLRGAAQAPIPAALSWLHGMPDNLGMMLNGPDPIDPNALELGDCTCAALAHARQVWTFNATGTMVTLDNKYVLALYEQACGYVLNDPSTDQGGNEQQLLIYCQTTGIPTSTGPDRIMGFVELELTVADIKRAIAEGGVVYLGIQIPEDWCSAPVGSIWDVSPSAIGGGHAIIGAAYDADYIYVVSWGLTWPMTWAAFRQYCDEAYVIFSHTWLRATGRTPFNVPMADFESAMNALGQEGPSDVKPA